MRLTDHAKFKLEIYNIPENEILEELKNPLYEFYDIHEESIILIILWHNIFIAGVCDTGKKKIITIYRTDEKTIRNRKIKKRWI